METARTAILLLNLGGPVSQARVEPFLRELFGDRELVRLPGPAWLQPHLARLIAGLRAPSSRRKYAAIGGGSPILRESALQAAALRARLREAGFGGPVKLVFRASPPRARRVLEGLAREGVTHLLPVSLYPHACRATTGSSLKELAREAARLDLVLLPGVESYATDPDYLAALEGILREGLRACPGATVVFSAHGLPLRQIRAGDPYEEEIRATVGALEARLGPHPGGFRLAYQSRVGPLRWLGPGLGEVLAELKGRDALVLPLSFVGEHLETLHELDLDYAERAARLGLASYRRLRTVGCDPRFIACLFRRTMEALGASA